MKTWKSAFVATIGTFAALNGMSFLVWSDLMALRPGWVLSDTVYYVGFPFRIWETGGFVGRFYFSLVAAIANLAVAGILVLFNALVFRFFPKGIDESPPPPS